MVSKYEAKPSRAPVPLRLRSIPGRLLNEAADGIKAATSELFLELGLTTRMASLLLVLEKSAFTQMDLGRFLQMDRTSIMHLIDASEAAGLVERRLNVSDRRSHLVTIAAKGTKLLPEIEGKLKLAQSDYFAALTKSELKELERLLLKVVESQPQIDG